MAPYKLSNYNFVFKYNSDKRDTGEMLLYNSRLGSLAIINEEYYAQYEQFSSKGVPINNKEFLSQLFIGGYLVEEGIEELDLVQLTLFENRYSSSLLSLTIVPTTECNFQCVYCYEKDLKNPIKMSQQTQQDLMSFVESRKNTIRNLSVTWYGGEPLLALDVITEMSEFFQNICNENGINYSAAIITNGYFLTPPVVGVLLSCGVNSIQVTLDGSKEQHDKRRMLKNGDATFDTIVNNLVSIKGLLNFPIILRINTDRSNKDDVASIITVLKSTDLLTSVRPYLAPVQNINDQYDHSICINNAEFSNLSFDFIVRNRLGIENQLPEQIANYCGADFNNSYVIDSNGTIYKCWSDLGNEGKSIGTLSKGLLQNSTFLEYMLYDATKDPRCSKCPYLPICMGGCPYQRLGNSHARCTQMKYLLEKYMSEIPQLLSNDLSIQ